MLLNYDAVTRLISGDAWPAANLTASLIYSGAEPFAINLFRSGAAAQLASDETLKLTLKLAPKFDSGSEVFVLTLAPGDFDSQSAKYLKTASLITSAMQAAIFDDNDPSNDKTYVDLIGSIGIVKAGQATPWSELFTVRLKNSAGRDTDGTPLALPNASDWLTARAVRYDVAQTLSGGQKLQASTNLGLALTASQILGQANAGGTGLPVAITLGTNLSISGTTLNATGGIVHYTDPQGGVWETIIDGFGITGTRLANVAANGTLATIYANGTAIPKVANVNGKPAWDTTVGDRVAWNGTIWELQTGGNSYYANITSSNSTPFALAGWTIGLGAGQPVFTTQ